MSESQPSADAGDDLRAALTGAFEASLDELPIAAAPGSAGATESAPPESDDDVRDHTDSVSDPSDPGRVAAQAPAASPASPLEISAPQSWSAPAKAAWASLPPDIKAEIAKREGDYARGIEAKSREARRYEPLERVIGPRREAWTAQFGSPERGLETLIAISDAAARDPQGFVRWFAQHRNVDLAKLTEAASAAPPPVPGSGMQSTDTPRPDVHRAALPELHVLARRFDQLEGAFAAQAQAQQQQILSSLAAAVEAFAADPKNAHFDAVAPDVLALVPVIGRQRPDATPAEILSEAYERTIWGTPGIRTQLLAEEAAAQARRQRADAQAQASRSKAAALSLSGAPPAGTSPTADAPATTLREELERSFAQRL